MVSASDVASPTAVLNASRCNILLVDIERVLNFNLPARYTPRHWEHNQYAVELWLRWAIENHPWRVADPAQADVTFAAANLSMWCIAGKTFSRRKLWAATFHPAPGAKRAIPEAASHAPVFVATQYEGACGQAYSPSRKELEPNIIALREEMMNSEFGKARQRVIVRRLTTHVMCACC